MQNTGLLEPEEDLVLASQCDQRFSLGSLQGRSHPLYLYLGLFIHLAHSHSLWQDRIKAVELLSSQMFGSPPTLFRAVDLQAGVFARSSNQAEFPLST